MRNNLALSAGEGWRTKCSRHSLSFRGGGFVLFWRTILEAKGSGMTEFDLGRTDTDDPGLLAFKDRCGTTRSLLTYARYAKH